MPLSLEIQQPPALIRQIEADLAAQINYHQQGDHARRGDRGHHRSIGRGTFGEQRFEQHHDKSQSSGRAERHKESRGHTHKDHGERRPTTKTILYARADATKEKNNHPLKEDVPLYTALQNLAHISPDRIEDATATTKAAWNTFTDGNHIQTFVDGLQTLSPTILKEISLGHASALTQIPGMKENHDMLLKFAPKGTESKLKSATAAVIASFDATTGQADPQSVEQLQQVVRDAGRDNTAVMLWAAFESSLLATSAVLAAKGKKREAAALLAFFTTTLSACVQHAETITPSSITPAVIEQSIESVGGQFNIITESGAVISSRITSADCSQLGDSQPMIIEFTNTQPTKPTLNLALCSIDVQVGSQPAGQGATLTEIVDGQVGNTFIMFGTGTSERRVGELVLVRDGQAVRGADENMTYFITTNDDGRAIAMDISGPDGSYHVTWSGTDTTSPVAISEALGGGVSLGDLTATPEATLQSTVTVTSSETPQPDTRAVLFSEMTRPEQCAQNLLQLDSPDYAQQLQAMMDSITTQIGEPATNLYFRPMPGTKAGQLSDIYPEAVFYFQSMDPDGHAPIATCGEIHFGDAVGRIQFVHSFPFPTEDGGFEPITFGLVHEPSAEKIADQIGNVDTYSTYGSDHAVFPVFKQGIQQVRLNFFVYPYTHSSQSTIDAYNNGMPARLEQTGSVIVPKLFDAQEQKHFSELFISVFYDGNRDPETLRQLKTLMEDQLLPGFIMIQQP